MTQEDEIMDENLQQSTFIDWEENGLTIIDQTFSDFWAFWNISPAYLEDFLSESLVLILKNVCYGKAGSQVVFYFEINYFPISFLGQM